MNKETYKIYNNILKKLYICKMKDDLFNLIQAKSPNSIPLYLVIRGSNAYGTNIPTSDIDYAGVFVQDIDSILGLSYIEQINDDNNDIVIYELRRFLELLSKNNPTILELLNTPEDCVIYKNPLFDIILDNRDKFLTKICASSFGGYASAQISKARGQDKKQNWEKDKVSRKDVLDFVYVIDGSKSIPWKEWNASHKFEEKFCGVVNIPNARDVYAVYYDQLSRNMFSDNLPDDDKEKLKNFTKDSGGSMGFGYKGLIKVGGSDNYGESNTLRLSSIPKGESSICNIIYNKDGYTQHCKDYKSYQEWIENRNEQRWVDSEKHGQKLDSKNLLHCVRLLRMSKEIAEGKGVIVRRPDADYLLKIRRGDVVLDDILNESLREIGLIKDIFANSTLPDSVDIKMVENILIDIRKKIYNLN